MLNLILMVVFFWIYLRPFDDVRSVVENVLVNYEGICGDFVNLKMLCRFSILKVLI